MATTSSTKCDISKFPLDPSFRRSIANRLNYYMKSSMYPIFFLKNQKKYIGPSHPFTIKEYVQAAKFDRFNIPANDGENFITLSLPREFVNSWQK